MGFVAQAGAPEAESGGVEDYFDNMIIVNVLDRASSGVQ
jgi:hypothetical protein